MDTSYKTGKPFGYYTSVMSEFQRAASHLAEAVYQKEKRTNADQTEFKNALEAYQAAREKWLKVKSGKDL